jgi:predicted patatin/cPLA2 family phospholipase
MTLEQTANPTTDPKVVVVCSDGAIRGGYIAGAFFALKEQNPLIWKYVTDFTASSASIGGIFYEMAYENDNPGKRLWTRDFADPKLINFWNFFRKGKKMYDIDYLVDVIFQKNNPCDISKIGQSKHGYYFPLIDYDSGRTVIFNNRFEDLSGKHPSCDFRLIKPELVYDYIRAATAAPILFDKTISIEGRNYIDAGIRVPFFVGDGIFDGYKKIVITTKGRLTKSNRMYYQFFGGLYAKYGHILGANLKRQYYEEIADKPNRYRDYEAYLAGMGSASDVFYIHPSQKLGGRFDNSVETLERNFSIGESDMTASREKLNEFIFGTR